MCGIFGAINGKRDLEDYINSLKLLKHRGPDNIGYFYDKQRDIFIGHTRLSIIDPKPEANQPFFSNDKKIILSFNGEIYNYKDLRKNYLSNYPFKTTSDTETIIALYEKFGIDFLKYLKGMYAISLLDLNKNKLYLIRDPFGKKPLYYYIDGNTIYYASEIKSILKILNSISLNFNSLYSYLRFMNPYILGESFFDGIKKLEANFYIEVDLLDFIVEKKEFYDFNYSVRKNKFHDEKEVLEILEDLIIESIRYRLVSDVEVVSFLSGGIDSSLVSSIANKLLDKRIKTFSIGYDSYQRYDEREYAKKVAEYIDSEHYEIVATKRDFINVLDDIIYYLDEPVSDPAVIPTFLISKLVNENNFKVVLSGEGSDELFLGYDMYFDVLKIDKITSFGFEDFLKDYFIKNFNNSKAWNYYYRKIEKNFPVYRSMAEVFTEKNIKSLLNNSVLESIRDYNKTEERVIEYYKNFLQKEEITKFYTYIDLKIWISEVLMTKIDRMTMSYSLEARSPFLDKELTEFIFSIDENVRVGNTNKYLLKKIALKYLPEDIVYRRKKGFSSPFLEWFLEENLFEEIIEFNKKEKFFQNDFIRYLIKEAKQKGYFKIHLWALYLFIKWYKRFF